VTQSILHQLARPMTMRMHVLACLEDEPKDVREIAAEVSQYMGRTVTKDQITCFLSRAIGEGVAVRVSRGRYVEPQDHFCEKNFAASERGVA
jgi:hypothetical protein